MSSIRFTDGIEVNGEINLPQFTTNKVLIIDSFKNIDTSNVNITELSYVSGVTSSIQTQINTKEPLLGFTPYNVTNPSGYISSFTETDPTVPAYSKTLSAFSIIKTSTDALYASIGSGVLSFNSRTGVVVPGSSDYNTSQIAEGSRLYYTDVRSDARITLQKGAALGITPLDSGAKINTIYLPDSVLGNLKYGGTYNGTIIIASSSFPELQGLNLPTTGYLGVYFITTTAFTRSSIDYSVGDWVIHNGSNSYSKVDNSDAVFTVFGRLGNILAIQADYSAFYPTLDGTYNNPSWINQLTWSKITNTPTTLLGYGITDAQPTLSGTGLVKSTTGTISYITDNSTNWNTAFSQTRQWDGGSTSLIAATGRTSLGGSTVGQNLFTLTNPSAITFIRLNADNSVSTLDAAAFRTAIGAGTSSTVGTVTSVAMSVPTGLTISGSPITTSGTLALTLTAGYSIPTTAIQANWNTAFGWGNHAGLYPTYVGTGATGTWGISITGNAATVTTNANLTGEVTSVGNAATVPNATVIGKVLTGYVSGAGTISATDNILQAIQKLNGNNATNANLTGPITSAGNVTSVASQTGTGSTFVMNTSPTLVTPNIGNATGGTLGLSGALTGTTGAFSGSVTTSSIITSGATPLLFRPNGVTRMTIGTDGDPITLAAPLTGTSATFSDEVPLNTNNPSTARKYIRIANTGSISYFGAENSTGSSIITGAPAYSTIIGSASNTPLILATNDAVRYLISGAGNHDFKTGTVTFGGALSGTSATFSGRVTINGATDNASYPLQVKGNLSSIDANNQNTVFLSASPSASYLATSWIGGGSAVPLHIQNNGINAITISTAGATTLTGSLTGTSATFSNVRASNTSIGSVMGKNSMFLGSNDGYTATAYFGIHASPTGYANDFAITGSADSSTLRFLHIGYNSGDNPSNTFFSHFSINTYNGSFKSSSLAGTGTRMVVADSAGAVSTQAIPSGGGGGTVVSVGVASANGFAGTSSGGTNPALTLSTTVTGILYGNGTSVATAVAGNFPTLNQSTTGNAGTATNVAYSGLTGTVPTWNQNTTGTAQWDSYDGNSFTGTGLYVPLFNGTKYQPASWTQVGTFLGLGSNAYTSTAYYPNSNPSGYITSASLSSYLLLTGGTLSGALTGTSATFSGIIVNSHPTSAEFKSSNNNAAAYYGNNTGGAYLQIYGSTHASSNKIDVAAAGGINLLNTLTGTSINLTNSLAYTNTNVVEAGFQASYTGTGALNVKWSAYNNTSDWYDQTNSRAILRYTASTNNLFTNSSINGTSASFSGNVSSSGSITNYGYNSAGNLAAAFQNVSSTGYGVGIRGGNASLYALQVSNYDGGTVALNVLGNGDVTVGNALITSAPSGGYAKPMKFGDVVAGVGSGTNSVQRVSIDGVVYYMNVWSSYV